MPGSVIVGGARTPIGKRIGRISIPTQPQHGAGNVLGR
jgi:hypothetical protein